uniref:Uncharacterized protein n=1 Tax=Ascaris lumbricoides TaxID=6252 RepID=A0A9J2Q250_ASCLU
MSFAGTELLDSMPIQQFSDDDDKKESEVDESKDEREPSERKGKGTSERQPYAQIKSDKIVAQPTLQKSVKTKLKKVKEPSPHVLPIAADLEAKCDEENKEAQMTAIEAIANLPSEEDNGDDEEEYVYGTGVPQVRSERVLKQKKGPSHPPQRLASEPSSSGAPSGGAQKIKYKEVDHYIEEQYLCGRDVGGAEEYVIFMPTGATSSSKNNNSNCRGQSDGNKGNNDRGQSNGSGSNVGAKDPTASSYAFL